MDEYSGVGLAAPQVHESLRIFVAHLDPEEPRPRRALAIINPEIEVVGNDLIEGWEGCLSIPDIRGRVPRAAADPRHAHSIATASASRSTREIFQRA